DGGRQLRRHPQADACHRGQPHLRRVGGGGRQCSRAGKGAGRAERPGGGAGLSCGGSSGAGRADRTGRVPGGLRLAEEGRRAVARVAMIRVRRSAVIDAPIHRVWAVLRAFNSHSAWHPAVGPSAIERGEAPDQVGCVRDFMLKDGNHIREQLLALSDRDHVSTYCILDATLPMRNYVATVQLKRVTDGDRTFWHWESTFDVPRGREREFEELVGGQVYEAGFTGLAALLRRGGRSSGPLQAGDFQGRG